LMSQGCKEGQQESWRWWTAWNYSEKGRRGERERERESARERKRKSKSKSKSKRNGRAWQNKFKGTKTKNKKEGKKTLKLENMK